MKRTEISTKEAVKMLANCRKNRLPIVLEVLEQAGFHFSDESIKTAYEESKGRTDSAWVRGNMTEYLKGRRSESNRDHWLDTTNEAALALREAYMDGLGFSKIAEYAGVSRKQPYVYMYGRVTPDKSLSNRLISAIERVRGEMK